MTSTTINQEEINGILWRACNTFQARRDCLQHYGNNYKYQICDFDFYKIHGEGGRDFFHVHYLKPLAEIGEEYKVNPKTDVLPVCPNCHAIIHRQRPTLTPDKVRAILTQNKEAQ